MPISNKHFYGILQSLTISNAKNTLDFREKYERNSLSVECSKMFTTMVTTFYYEFETMLSLEQRIDNIL